LKKKRGKSERKEKKEKKKKVKAPIPPFLEISTTK